MGEQAGMGAEAITSEQEALPTKKRDKSCGTGLIDRFEASRLFWLKPRAGSALIGGGWEASSSRNYTIPGNPMIPAQF